MYLFLYQSVPVAEPPSVPGPPPALKSGELILLCGFELHFYFNDFEFFRNAEQSQRGKRK